MNWLSPVCSLTITGPYIMTIYIFKYNNYYNRIYKRLETLSEYEEQGEMIYYIRNANFNPNDGVSTSHVFGQNGIPSSDFQTYDGSGDYVIVLNDSNEIDSRWFIIEARRKMAGQFELILRRDLIADYNDIIIRAPIFIEKAVLSSTDPLI